MLREHRGADRLATSSLQLPSCLESRPEAYCGISSIPSHIFRAFIAGIVKFMLFVAYIRLTRETASPLPRPNYDSDLDLHECRPDAFLYCFHYLEPLSQSPDPQYTSRSSRHNPSCIWRPRHRFRCIYHIHHIVQGSRIVRPGMNFTTADSPTSYRLRGGASAIPDRI
jgi:hypothetical protein